MPKIIKYDDLPPQGKYLISKLWDLKKSQTWLAEQTNITTGMISHIITGKRVPSPKYAQKIAKALGVPLEDLSIVFSDKCCTKK